MFIETWNIYIEGSKILLDYLFIIDLSGGDHGS